jgi:RES domain-containing protein
MEFHGKITPKTGHLVQIEGEFFRTIDPIYRCDAIAGSRLPGRYSSDKEPTLYPRATRAGMAAASDVHKENRSSDQEVTKIEVAGDHIFDLRNKDACLSVGIELGDALSPWQPLVALGKTPPSWNVRKRIIEIGGKGLIDPSRQISGLWHLVLFVWNQKVAPKVTVVG